MSAWDINNIRRIAGLPPVEAPKPITESWDDDGDTDLDDDPDVKIAGEDKSQAAFEKKNKKELTKAEQEAKDLKKKPAAKKPEAKKEEPKKDEKKPEAKKAEPKKAAEKPAEAKKEEPKKAEAAKDDVDPKDKEKAGEFWKALENGKKGLDKEKAEKSDKEDSAEAKRRGRAPSEDSKQGKARAWLAANAKHTRGDFIKHMSANHGMSPHHANTMYYAEKKRSGADVGPKKDVKEVFFLQHPFVSTFMLAENREMNAMQWVDADSDMPLFVFETEAEAQKVAKYMSEWKGQAAVVYKYAFGDDAE